MRQRSSQARTAPELVLEPETLETLTSVRDDALTTKQQERRQWYARELARHSGSEVEAEVAERASRLLKTLLVRLHEAAERGDSSISYQAVRRHESIGWKYAQLSFGKVVSGPLDLSMLPFDHFVRIEATERVAGALARGGLQCEVSRVPAGCANCFLEELCLKVSIPPKKCLAA